ncbi:CaiB/BaiF CoA transferase family protein [Chloroflexota bacterium]
MKSAALEGLKVFDLSWVIAGPLLTKILADYGATVVRLESSKKPDIERTSPPFKDGIPGINRSGYYANWNTSKLSLSLNIKHPEGRKILEELIEWADVLVENFTPGVMENMGLGYDEVTEINPSIIMLSISSNGQTGPFAKVPGLGLHTASISGLVHLTGWPDAEHPQRIGPYCDLVTPYFGVAALLAAIGHRRRTGKGQYIDLSQYESGLQFLIDPLLDFQLNDNLGGRKGNRSACAAPHGVYRCKGSDRWCAITVFNEQEWEAFCKATSGTDWYKDARFSSLANRKQNEGELDKLVDGWTVNHNAEEVFGIMHEAGVPCGIVQNSADLVNDPQLKYRDLLWVQDHKEIGKFHSLGEVAILSKTPARQYMPAPLLGEHTEQICHDILHMSDEKFIELLDEGVFE